MVGEVEAYTTWREQHDIHFSASDSFTTMALYTCKFTYLLTYLGWFCRCWRPGNTDGSVHAVGRRLSTVQWGEGAVKCSPLRFEFPRGDLVVRGIPLVIHTNDATRHRQYYRIIDWTLRINSADENVLNFHGTKNWRTLRKTGCYWTEEYATSQLHKRK